MTTLSQTSRYWQYALWLALFTIGLGFVDSLGALGLIYFSVREGKEALEKAANLE